MELPEIWLSYGTTHAVLDIKIENLASHLSSKFPPMPEEQLRADIGNINFSDEVLILALTGSRATADIVSRVVETARAKGVSNITLDAPTTVAATLRAAFEAASPPSQDNKVSRAISINRLEHGFPVRDRIQKFKTVITISQVGIDPLFGYCGSPTFLLRYFLLDKMAEAFASRSTVGPSPARETEPLRIAQSSAQEATNVISIEIIANSLGIGGIHIGSLSDSFAKAQLNLKSLSVAEIEMTASLIASASSDPYGQSTLSHSLNSLWNCVGSGILRQGGHATLVCECRNGIGSGALQKYIEGRLGDSIESATSKGEYIDGLEHLIFLKELKQKYELALVSALPKHYTNAKLGFTRYSGIGEAASAVTSKHGKSSKLLVVSDPDIMIISAKPGS